MVRLQTFPQRFIFCSTGGPWDTRSDGRSKRSLVWQPAVWVRVEGRFPKKEPNGVQFPGKHQLYTLARWRKKTEQRFPKNLGTKALA